MLKQQRPIYELTLGHWNAGEATVDKRKPQLPQCIQTTHAFMQLAWQAIPKESQYPLTNFHFSLRLATNLSN
jgi:hypothetical protein